VLTAVAGTRLTSARPASVKQLPGVERTSLLPATESWRERQRVRTWGMTGSKTASSADSFSVRDIVDGHVASINLRRGIDLNRTRAG